VDLDSILRGGDGVEVQNCALAEKYDMHSNEENKLNATELLELVALLTLWIFASSFSKVIFREEEVALFCRESD
jgi:hypothetical protein